MGVSIRIKVFNATFDNISVISGAIGIFGGEHQCPEQTMKYCEKYLKCNTNVFCVLFAVK
jgi:hypothetical protein